MTAVIPSVFFMTHLGRWLLPQDETTGNPEADAERALGRTHPHLHSDLVRALRKLEMVRGKKSAEQEKVAEELAQYRVVEELLERPEELGLTPPEVGLLREAYANASKKGRSMIKPRLGENMMAVVSEARTVLMANIAFTTIPENVEHRPCSGRAAYFAMLLDALRAPPPPPFMLIEFQKATLKPSDLALNHSGRRIRVSTSPAYDVDPGRLVAAIEMVKGREIGNVVRLTELLERRRLRIQDAADIDRKLFPLADRMAVDAAAFDEVVPALQSRAFTLLRSALLAAAEDNQEIGEGDHA